MKKKLLAMVMTLAMVLSLVPVTALAEEEVTTPTQAETQATPQEGDTRETKDLVEGTEEENQPSNNNPVDPQENDDQNNNEEKEEQKQPEQSENSEEEDSDYVAKIGTEEYNTLDEAVAASKESDTIELLKNCELTVNTISKAITVNGNGKTINIPKQETESGGLQINAPATFLNTKLAVCNPDETSNQDSAWSITMNGDGVFTLDQGSECTITTRGIYTTPNAIINVLGGSKLNLQETTYTAMMAEAYANLNVSDGSEVYIDHAYHGDGVPNGITSFKIVVTNSDLTVTNCENQGLVSCWLTLDDSEAEISGNDIGITGQNATDVLIMKNRSTLNMKDNNSAGIFLYGGKVEIQEDNTLTITGTGSQLKEPVTPKYYCGAISIYAKVENRADVTFADGAIVTLKDNGLPAINNLNSETSTFYVGNSTKIVCNGSKTNYGGGIYNFGAIEIAEGAEVYNNHAAIAGDDIYNSSVTKYTGTITFGATGEGWKLDGGPDCEHDILGWFKDGMENNEDGTLKRWNGDGKGDAYYADEYTGYGKEAVSDALALKAAHPLVYQVKYVVTGDIPEGYVTPAGKTVKANGKYTVEAVPASGSVTKDGVRGTYSFAGWTLGQNGPTVTGERTLTQDETLYGVWSFRRSGGGGGGSSTVDIPDEDVPTGLDLKNHYGYIIGYPVDYYTGEPTTDQTKKPVRPEGKITRAEVATIYFRMLTEENRAANWNQVSGFSDVKSKSWYNNAISTLTKAGILEGYEDGTFRPNGYITRAEFATIAIRFFSGVYEGEDLFPDIKDHWARDYINNAADKGLVKGYEDGTFGPDRYITRAEAVTLVNRTLNRHPDKDCLHEDMLVWPDNMDTSKWYYADMQEATNSHEPDKDKSDSEKEYWSKTLPIRDWEALEKEWSNANSAPGEGEVV